MLEKDYLKITLITKIIKSLKIMLFWRVVLQKGLLDILEKNPQFLKKDKFYYELDNRIFTQIPLGEFENSSVGVLLISFDKNINNFRYLPKYDYFIDVEIKDEKNDNKDILKRDNN